MNGLIDFLKSTLPHDVAFAAGTVEQARADLFDVERLAVAGAVAKRQREFSAGRAYARAALATLACPPVAIPVAADRRPIWPRGFVGSISHCERFCAAIVGRADAYVGLGIDIEDDAAVEDGVRDIVCRPEELRQSAAAESPAATVKMFFVAKEALFKAYYPATRAFLDFHDVSVVLDERRGSFQARLTAPDKPELAGSRSFVGHLGRTEGHVIAVVAIASERALASGVASP